MHTLSTKELRQKMPFVRSELKKGTSFLLIHQSKPIAQLYPVKNAEINKEDIDFEPAAIVDFCEGDDFLTPEELNYYLSL